ncbi:hypothetical protein ACJX0J_042542, partial [Zea mays]
IESEDSKVSVGNAAKQSHDVVGVGIDCIFNHAKVSTEADLGPQPDVIHLTSLDVPNESSQISSDADMVEQNKKDALDTLIRISQHKKPKKSNVARVVSEDYKCTPEDVQLIEYIKTLPGKQVVVNIDSAWLNRNDMECLFHGDIELSSEALSAYIHCIRDEEHLLHREGGKVFLENTFISSLLKRDGDPKMLLNYKEDTIETRVDNYLQSDMVFIPMNIENFHWYLAVLNAKKSELKGLERQIKLAAEHKELYQGKWSNLDVASWPVIEKITTQMQTDGVSCGLWMINYMEYWTGSSLSDNVTQDDITMFRFKLPAILWDSRLNTKKGHQNLDHNVDEDGESSSDVQIIDTPLTSTNTQELMFVLCTYIMGIDNAKYLKKHWIQSTKPYPISLSLQKLKDILDVNKPMDTDCFNMAVRMIACNDALFLLEDKYHYMDLQFCVVQSNLNQCNNEDIPFTNLFSIFFMCNLKESYEQESSDSSDEEWSTLSTPRKTKLQGNEKVSLTESVRSAKRCSRRAPAREQNNEHTQSEQLHGSASEQQAREQLHGSISKWFSATRYYSRVAVAKNQKYTGENTTENNSSAIFDGIQVIEPNFGLIDKPDADTNDMISEKLMVQINLNEGIEEDIPPSQYATRCEEKLTMTQAAISREVGPPGYDPGENFLQAPAVPWLKLVRSGNGDPSYNSDWPCTVFTSTSSTSTYLWRVYQERSYSSDILQVKDLMCLCDNAFTRDQVLTKEKAILDRLHWNLTVPTMY